MHYMFSLKISTCRQNTRFLWVLFNKVETCLCILFCCPSVQEISKKLLTPFRTLECSSQQLIVETHFLNLWSIYGTNFSDLKISKIFRVILNHYIDKIHHYFRTQNCGKKSEIIISKVISLAISTPGFIQRLTWSCRRLDIYKCFYLYNPLFWLF